MQLVDVIIFLLLGFGGVTGLRRGFFKQTVMAVGAIVVVILAFMFKNPVSIFLYSKLPFFKFGGFFAGVSALNIIVYEILAFLIVGSILFFLFRILVGFTSLLEKFLNYTIFLGIPSKILGFGMGLVEAYVWIFVFLYILTLPFFNIELINESQYKTRILTNTPIISHYTEKMMVAINEIYELKGVFAKETDSNVVNLKAIDILLNNKIVTVKSIEQLQADEKLKVSGLGPILDKYR